MQKPVLFGHATSSSSFRVRIALNIKEIDYESVSVTAGIRKSAEYTARNPLQLVPALQLNENELISQSLSVMEYIEEAFPGKALLPDSPLGKARTRAIAQYIVSEIQPLHNSRLDKYMTSLEMDISSWKQHWVKDGLQHLEALLDSPATGDFCHGNSPTMADCCLVPQVFKAVNDFQVSLAEFPIISKLYANNSALEAVKRAWPDKQADYHV